MEGVIWDEEGLGGGELGISSLVAHYDLPRPTFQNSGEKYLDGVTYANDIYRAITNWYIRPALKPMVKDKLYPENDPTFSGGTLFTPENFTPAKKWELRGLLLPAHSLHYTPTDGRRMFFKGAYQDAKQTAIPFRVRIKSLSLDGSVALRGAWFESPNGAWYRLLDPHQHPADYSGSGVSQTNFSKRRRALFDLSCDITDAVMQKDYMCCSMTPAEVYHLSWCESTPKPADHVMDGSNKEGVFDSNLLKREAKWIIKNFKNILMWKRATFKKGLDEMAAEFNAAKKNNKEWAVGDYPYEVSATRSENRRNLNATTHMSKKVTKKIGTVVENSCEKYSFEVRILPHPLPPNNSTLY
ncbi:hypothetical protein TL16_g07548 [Triparma laevis f. inornata]|uniref:Uncharacterized protein n=1 Tax=Triparma laevis f. inornata TaxID=1714386 RepID=A0A9W7EH73_9STRA|nr:hypothetical protein TL16_g07548 [Triparma laevis f. inornata]